MPGSVKCSDPHKWSVQAPAQEPRAVSSRARIAGHCAVWLLISSFCQILGMSMLGWRGQPTPPPLNLTVTAIAGSPFPSLLLRVLHLEAIRKSAFTLFPSSTELIELCIPVITCSLIYFPKLTSSSSRPYLSVPKSRQKI